MDHHHQNGNHYTAPSSAYNPYMETVPVHPDSAPTANNRPLEKMCVAVGRCGRRFEDATKKAEGYADGIWRHLKVSPNLADTAMARIQQGTKLLAEGGTEKVFSRTFGSLPEEKLLNSYACYLSTSTGPVIGTLYVSNKRVAFCSDFPLLAYRSPTAGHHQQWLHYKVVMRVEQLSRVNSSRSSSERYIQLVTVDNHEFWFMGFISFDRALEQLRELLHPTTVSPSSAEILIK
ncbi:unnamed protein product [Linum trigynum]|uniref:GRAM domain-containing protein n=1 Tax=Linum trigynum TaxID=586398 RepID=A0AAV2CMF5_9ROSI